MSVDFYRESPGKFDSRTLNRETLNRWTGRIFRHPRSRYFSILFPNSASQLERCTFKRLLDSQSATGKVPKGTEKEDV